MEPSRRLYEPQASRVSARINLVIGIVIIFRLRAHARRSRAGFGGRIVLVVLLFLNVGLFDGVEGIVDHFLEPINGSVVVRGILRRGFAALREEIFQREDFGMRRIELFLRLVGDLSPFAFDISVVPAYAVRIGVLIEIIRHRVLHHDFTAGEIVHQRIKRLFVSIAVAAYISGARVEEVGDEIPFENILIDASDDVRILGILPVALEIVVAGNIYGADYLRHVLFAVGRDQPFAACRRAERKCDAQTYNRYLPECVSVLHKPAPSFYRVYLCCRKTLQSPLGGPCPTASIITVYQMWQTFLQL